MGIWSVWAKTCVIQIFKLFQVLPVFLCQPTNTPMPTKRKFAPYTRHVYTKMLHTLWWLRSNGWKPEACRLLYAFMLTSPINPKAQHVPQVQLEWVSGSVLGHIRLPCTFKSLYETSMQLTNCVCGVRLFVDQVEMTQVTHVVELKDQDVITLLKRTFVPSVNDAAKEGNVLLLEYLYQTTQNVHWDEWTCAYAARTGHLECLKYLHEHGCPWNGWVCEGVTKNGHLECLKYLHENRCPRGGRACACAASKVIWSV